MICLSSEMKQRGGLVWFDLSQVSESLDFRAAHLLLLPSVTRKARGPFRLPVPAAALLLVIRLFDVIPDTQKGCFLLLLSQSW